MEACAQKNLSSCFWTLHSAQTVLSTVKSIGGLQVKVARRSPFSYNPAALAEATADVSTVTSRF